jgi:DNA-binding SARP family transcriptional activator
VVVQSRHIGFESAGAGDEHTYYCSVPALDVRVLGPFEVWRSGARIPLGRSKERDLLALLTSRSPHVVPADVIAEELWQGRPPPSARKVVQKHVSELRQRLGPTHVVTAGGGYALRDVTIDADRFEAAYYAARFAAPPVARDRLGTTLASWTGDPTPTWSWTPWRPSAPDSASCASVPSRR